MENKDKLMILSETGLLEVVEKTELVAKKRRRVMVADEDEPMEHTN